MDKDVAKRLRDAGIPDALRHATERTAAQAMFEKLSAELGVPFFVKPANSGSSVGVSKAPTPRAGLRRGPRRWATIKAAGGGIDPGPRNRGGGARQRRSGGLGPGRDRAGHDFYSYEAKNLDENGAMLLIPAEPPGGSGGARAESL